MHLFIFLSSFRFLEEQNKKGKSWENGKTTEANDVDREEGKVNGKTSTVVSDSRTRKHKKDSDGEVSLSCFLKASPFLSADGGEEEEMITKPHSKPLHRDWPCGDESSKPKIKVTNMAPERFEECFGKWQTVSFSQVSNSDLDSMAEDVYLSRKQDKAAIAAALAKRELADEMSPEKGGKARKMAKSPPVLSPSPPLPRRNSEREMLNIRNEDSPFMSSRKQEAKLNMRMDFLGDSLIR